MSYLLQKVEALILDCLERGLVNADGQPEIVTETLVDDCAPTEPEALSRLRQVRAFGELRLDRPGVRFSERDRMQYAAAFLALYRELLKPESVATEECQQ